MRTLIIQKTSKKSVRKCFEDGERTRRKTMISFREWSTGKTFPKKKKKGEKSVPTSNQGSSEVRNVNQQGEIARDYSQIVSNDVHYFPEP